MVPEQTVQTSVVVPACQASIHSTRSSGPVGTSAEVATRIRGEATNIPSRSVARGRYQISPKALIVLEMRVFRNGDSVDVSLLTRIIEDIRHQTGEARS